MVIREAKIEDAASITEFIKQLGYEIRVSDVEQNIIDYDRVKGHVLVVEENKGIIGFVAGAYIPMFHKEGLMFRITALCVDKFNRSLGAGKQLIKAIEDKCRENDCYYIEVTSGAQRKNDAHLFYIRLGYTVYEGKRFLKSLDV